MLDASCDHSNESSRQKEASDTAILSELIIVKYLFELLTVRGEEGSAGGTFVAGSDFMYNGNSTPEGNSQLEGGTLTRLSLSTALLKATP